MTRSRLLAAAGMVACGVAVGLVLARWLPHGDAEPEHDETPHGGAATPQDEDDAEPAVELSAEALAHADLATSPLAAASNTPATAAFGRIEFDPAAIATLRAPVSGTVIATTGRDWPHLGERLTRGMVVGALAPRLAPAERADLEQRALAAELDATTAATAADLAQKELSRTRALNAQGKNASDREVEAAEQRLLAETSRRDSAQQQRDRLRALLQGDPAALPLSVPADGECIEPFASAGEQVEAGHVLLRVVDASRLVARVTPPIGAPAQADATTARLEIAGATAPLAGRRLARDADGNLLFAFDAPPGAGGDEGHLRPGQPVTAWLPRPGDPETGVVVPFDAVVRHRGRAVVFVRTGDPAAAPAGKARFAVRALTTDRRLEAGWFVPVAAGAPEAGEHPLATGDQVVTRGAAMLLSRLLRSEIPETDEAPEEGK